jgi:trehalose-6-phosphate synthase
MALAARMPHDELRQRMKAMRSYLSHFNVYRWAGRMLLDAAALRRREQVLDRAFGRRQAAPPIAETASGAWRRGE